MLILYSLLSILAISITNIHSNLTRTELKNCSEQIQTTEPKNWNFFVHSELKIIENPEQKSLENQMRIDPVAESEVFTLEIEVEKPQDTNDYTKSTEHSQKEANVLTRLLQSQVYNGVKIWKIVALSISIICTLIAIFFIFSYL